MKSIANFYTLFWIVYFPTCIAFNTLPGFSSIDEVMTAVLIVYTGLTYGSKYTNRVPWKEYFLFWGVLTFYTVYSLIWGENVSGGVYLEFLQQIRPYSIIYCTWILNPQFSRKQKNLMALAVVLTLIARTIIRTEGAGVQADVSAGQIAICAGMTWLIFKKNTRRNIYIAILFVLIGLITCTKSKFFGEVVCFIGIALFMKKKIDLASNKTFILSMLLGAVVLFFVWDKFDAYYLSGFSDEDQARPMTTKVAFTKILWDYIPFGPGMGTFATNGAWKYYSPLYMKYDLNEIWGLTSGGGFICDIFYPSLVQYGIVGIFFFLWFWKRRLSEFNKIQELSYFRVALLAFLCLAIEQTADSSWLSGKGMGYCMLIGLCLNANRNAMKRQKRLQMINERNNVKSGQTKQSDEEDAL